MRVLNDMIYPIRTCKSDIFDFSVLDEDEQKRQLDLNPEAEEDNYVEFQYSDGKGILPLSSFIRSQSGRYHGYYATSNSGGFGIILSKRGDYALISLF